MATYLVIGTFTEKGISKVKDTVKRTKAYQTMAKKCGCAVKDTYWLLGKYDMLAIVDAPNDAAVTSLQLSAGALGNFRAQTLRAFTPAEIEPILSKMVS